MTGLLVKQLDQWAAQGRAVAIGVPDRLRGDSRAETFPATGGMYWVVPGSMPVYL